MAITKKDKYYYGDSQSDLHEVLLDYSEYNKYKIDHFRDAVCSCGNKMFFVFTDEEAGVTERSCTECNNKHYIGDSNEYVDKAESIEEMECLCGSNNFYLTVGVSLYVESDDIKWFYLGLFCPKCRCMGCYGDWKNEFLGYKKFMNNV